MKAEINADGKLVLMADNSTEAYALRVWLRESRIEMKSALYFESELLRGSSIVILEEAPKS